MTKRVLVLSFALVGFANAAAAENPSTPTAEKFPTLNFAIDGSLPLQYESNPTRVETKRQPDYVFSPYFKLSAFGDLRPDLSYSFYAATSVDRYLQTEDNTGSLAAFGTQLIKKWESLQLGVTYEHSYGYDKDFETLFSSNNDFGVFLRYSYTNPAGDFNIRPYLTATTRLDEGLALQRNLYSFKIDFERRLIDRWWIILTPRVRYYNYFDTQAGRRDLITSISTGLKFDVSRDVNFTTSIGYENRASNIPGKNYDNLIIGASLDFSYTYFGRHGGGAGSDFLQWLSH